MAIITDRATALSRLAGIVPPDIPPKLTTDEALNQIFKLTVTGTAGAYTLTFDDGVSIPETTEPIDFDAVADDILAALEGLPSIGEDNVEVEGTGPFFITFVENLAATPIVTPEINSDDLEGTVAIEELVEGSPQGEFPQILDNNKRASIWVADTEYAVGDLIIPITRNGHRFKCTTPGTSGDEEPEWSTLREISIDDNSIVWEEAGIEIDLWDFTGAAQEAIQLKMNKAVPFIGTDDGLATVYDHLAELLLQYQPVRIG